MTAVSSSRSARWPEIAKYELKGELGRGGMATVYLAHDARLARDVAIKVLHPHLRDSSELAHRFAVEARAVAKLRHPNILEVYDVSEEADDEHFLVVELLDGFTLRKLLAERGPMPAEVAAALGMELAEALAHAHAQGVVHRDVKPENVMIEHGSFAPLDVVAKERAEERKAERAFRVKLTDFGIAKLLDAQGVTATGQVLGSPAHMAPEQIEGGEVDARADVFGLGVLLYECMVGHLPFEGSNPAQVLKRVLDGFYAPAERERPIIGKEWSGILDRMLAHRPEDRFASMAELGDALKRELDDLGVNEPRAHMIAYFTDPQTYVAAERPRLVERLRALGAEARHERRFLDAGSRYNRVLAFEPQDAEALRVVARLRRGESAAYFVRRRILPFVGIAVLGVCAFGVTRRIRGSVMATVPTTEPSPRAPLTVPTGSGSVAVPVPATVSVALPPTRPPPTVTVATPNGNPSTTPAVTKKRMVRVAALRPIGGVRVSIDGAPARDVVVGQELELDDRAHDLAFSCVEDMCDPLRQQVPASDHDEALSVDMRIKSAVLIVTGDPTHSYTIKEHPGRFRVQTKVAMSRGAERVTVVELETGETRFAVLRAGAQANVSFIEP